MSPRDRLNNLTAIPLIQGRWPLEISIIVTCCNQILSVPRRKRANSESLQIEQFGVTKLRSVSANHFNGVEKGRQQGLSSWIWIAKTNPNAALDSSSHAFDVQSTWGFGCKLRCLLECKSTVARIRNERVK